MTSPGTTAPRRKTIDFTPEALEMMTNKQLRQVSVIAAPETVSFVDVRTATGGLPERYLAVTVFYKDAARPSLFGGIAPDGEMST